MPPSSMISEPTTMSPKTLPVARISRRPVVFTLPWIIPPTTTLRPLTLPLTRPCSPTDRSPSVVKSPFISPSNRMLDVDCSRPSSLIWLLSTVSATMGAASRGDLLSNTGTSWQVVSVLCQNGYAIAFLLPPKRSRLEQTAQDDRAGDQQHEHQAGRDRDPPQVGTEIGHPLQRDRGVLRGQRASLLPTARTGKWPGKGHRPGSAAGCRLSR